MASRRAIMRLCTRAYETSKKKMKKSESVQQRREKVARGSNVKTDVSLSVNSVANICAQNAAF